MGYLKLSRRYTFQNLSLREVFNECLKIQETQTNDYLFLSLQLIVLSCMLTKIKDQEPKACYQFDNLLQENNRFHDDLKTCKSFIGI